MIRSSPPGTPYISRNSLINSVGNRQTALVNGYNSCQHYFAALGYCNGEFFFFFFFRSPGNARGWRSRNLLWLTGVQLRKKALRGSFYIAVKIASQVKNIFVFNFPPVFAYALGWPPFIIGSYFFVKAPCLFKYCIVFLFDQDRFGFTFPVDWLQVCSNNSIKLQFTRYTRKSSRIFFFF